MTSAEFAKENGFKSLKEAAKMLGKPQQTLNHWRRENPVLFRAAILGASFIKKSLAQSEKGLL